MTKVNASDPDNRWSSSKALAGALSIAVMCIVLSPVVQNWTSSPRDDFPLSYYPMFTKPRDDEIEISHVIGFDGEGNVYRIRYHLAGSGGMNQVRKQIRRRVSSGKAGHLCQDVAHRIDRIDSGPLAKIDAIAVVTSTFDLDEFMQGDTRVERQIVEATCQVD